MSDEVTLAAPISYQSGWRPALGWVVVVGFALQFAGIPIGNIILAILNRHTVIPNLDMAPLLSLTSGVLGLSGLRTYEKLKGISTP